MSDTRKAVELDIEAYCEFCSKHNITPRWKSAGFYRLPDPIHMNRVLLTLSRINEFNSLMSQKLTLELKAKDLRNVIEAELDSLKEN